MAFSSFADMERRIPDVGRSSPRNDRIKGVLIHHNAGVNAYGQATAAGRSSSSDRTTLLGIPTGVHFLIEGGSR